MATSDDEARIQRLRALCDEVQALQETVDQLAAQFTRQIQESRGLVRPLVAEPWAADDRRTSKR